MRRLHLVPVMVMASAMLVACGGARSKGDAGDDRSSYEQLAAISEEIDQQVDEVRTPIEQADTIIAELEQLPTKYKLSTDEVRELLRASLTGEPVEMPASLAQADKENLQKFLGDLGQFKQSVVSAPDAATELGKTLAQALAEVPVLVGKVSTEAAAVKANPLASEKDKAEADKQVQEAKALEKKLTEKIKQTQSEVAGLPAKATAALGKFTQALTKVGLDNVDALLQVGEKTVGDAKQAGNEAVSDSVGAATGTAEAAAEGAAEAAETAVEEAEGAAAEAAEDAAEGAAAGAE